MPETVPPSGKPDAHEVLATLDGCLDALDRLGMAGVAAQLSFAVETLRSELSKGSAGLATNDASR